MSPAGRGRADWYADADADRLQIFVPAIMGVGVVISLYTLLRDAWQAHRWRGAGRRAGLAARATAWQARTGGSPDPALAAGLRPRVGYLLTGLATGGVAGYVTVGASYNYFNPEGLVRGIAWLWAVSLLASAAFLTVSVVSLVAFWTWPRPPGWLRAWLVRTPLGQAPGSSGGGYRQRSLLLGWAAAGTTAAAALFVFMMARAPYVFEAVDDWMHTTARQWTWAERLAPLDALGRTHPAVLLAALIGLATLRCVPFAAGYLASVLVGLAADLAVKALVARDRPPSGALASWTESFPSGHLIQATLIAGLVPLALLVLTRRRWVAAVAVAVLVPAVLATGILRLHRAVHWWSDAVGGILIGAAIVLVTWWLLGDGRWHRHCRGACPWSAAPGRPAHPPRVLLPIHPRVEPALTWLVRGWLPAAIVGLLVLAGTVGVPRNPEGDGLITELEQPLQLGLLGLAGLAWLLSWRWPVAAALVLVLAGNGLGVLAALAYQPLVGLLVMAAFLVPAAGLWVVWQHRRDLRAVVAVAVTAALLVAGTWAGSSAVYDHFYGPAHPVSAQPALPVEQVVWAWAGGVSTDRATVVAELVPGSQRARLVLWPEPGRPAAGVRRTGYAPVPADRVVRLAAGGLAADTGYRYAVEVDGVVDRTRGAGRLRTMPAGPASFTVAVGACARTGSSGAVYDAIRRTRPLLYLVTGDLHYGNPDSTDVDLFAGLYRQTLTAPAQAALYRSVPVGYVWDDHDYGPNDADAGAESRAAARTAYRRYVPHYPLPAGADGAVYQAFTAGRVRFILTDTRSERSRGSMLGARQLAWLERELVTASRSHALVVWVNPDPWVAAAEPGSDNWGGYPAERSRIADVIAAADIRNLVMLAGDAHMVAIDDGTHTGYSTTGHPGFPLLHAAALDRPGSQKGGPYSEGAFPGAGQFGTLTVRDTGGAAVSVELTGRNWRGEVLVSYRTAIPVPAQAAR